MISIARFLGRGEDGTQDAVYALAESLVETAAAAALPYDPAKHKEFLEDLRDIGSRITPEATPEHMAVIADMFSKVMDGQKRGLERILREQSTELKALAKLVTRTLTVVGAEDQKSLEKITELSRDIDRVQTLREMIDFKGRLKQSIEELQKQSEERRRQRLHAEEELKRQLAESRARLADFQVDPAKDAVTGLPSREQGIEHINSLSARDSQSFAVVLNLQQLPALNVKFGHKTGNAVLQSYRDHLERRTGGAGRIFRWGGKCFVAVFGRSDVSKEEGGDIVRSLGATINLEVDNGSRTMMVPISPRWLCLGRTEALAATPMLERIEKFAADL